jgi:TolA-binding protein
MSTPRRSLEQIGLRVAAAGDRALDTGAAPDVDDVLAGVARLRRRASRRRAAWAGVTATALAVALGLAAGRMRTDAPRGDLAAASPATGPRRADREPLPLDFADGTRVIVKPGAQTNVREVRPHGAVVALERGTIDVHVVHTDATRWDVLAGEFDVTVTGTRFDATWDPDRRELTVAMSEGTVRVSGPCVHEDLSAPNRKTFSCGPAPAVSAPAAPTLAAAPALTAAPTSPSSPPSAAVTASDAPRAASRDAAKAVVARSTPGASTRAGDSTPTARASESNGPSTLERADAARLAGDSRGARALYAQARAERPGSREAVKAAFLLGRLAEDAGDVAEAARWYDVVGREGEGGPLAQDALGRTIELEQRQGHTSRARALAERYLAAHPRGPHSSYARSVLDASR